MQGTTPIEMKHHLKDIERSFAACQTPAHSKARPQTGGTGWIAVILKWIRRPSAAATARLVD